MRRVIESLVFLIGISISSSAAAGLVASLSAGAAMPNIESSVSQAERNSTGFLVGGGIGMRFGDFFQWDVAETYLMGNEDDFGTNAFNYSIGTGVRLGTFGGDSKFHPYASFGIGAGRFSVGNFISPSAWQWGFEWNTGVGVLYELSDEAALGFRYRYWSSSTSGWWDANSLSYHDLDVNIHTIGVEVLFGR